jgi:hypothetical protein
MTTDQRETLTSLSERLLTLQLQLKAFTSDCPKAQLAFDLLDTCTDELYSLRAQEVGVPDEYKELSEEQRINLTIDPASVRYYGEEQIVSNISTKDLTKKDPSKWEYLLDRVE